MSAGRHSRRIGPRPDIMRLSRPWSLRAGRRMDWCVPAVPRQAARWVEMLQLVDFAENVFSTSVLAPAPTPASGEPGLSAWFPRLRFHASLPFTT